MRVPGKVPIRDLYGVVIGVIIIGVLRSKGHNNQGLGFRITV